MIQAIFFDIDGTLLSHRTKRVPPDTVEALKELKTRGILLFAATGRHLLELSDLPMGDLPFDGYVTMNGQICLDKQKKKLFGCPIGPEDTKKLAALFATKTVPMQFEEENRIYINFVNERVRRVLGDISTPITPIGQYLGDPLYKLSVYVPEDEVPGLELHLTGCTVTSWHREAVDIFPDRGGKAAGIQRMLTLHGLTRNQAMAFGDGDNDICMLTFAAIGIAMGNASPNAKAAADFITTDIDEGGIVNALRRYGVL